MIRKLEDWLPGETTRMLELEGKILRELKMAVLDLAERHAPEGTVTLEVELRVHAMVKEGA